TLMGFMIGSLNKVWPWKEVLETYTDSHGKMQPLVEANVWPEHFEWQAVLLCAAGFLAIYGIEQAARTIARKRK
ncbi:MAG: DUF368 domain-containing protein, partial [Alistipes sp.]|nr:DUF368 domain-containing protein [Alistipes sp.]